MEASPRVLLADTIGFIDHLPSATLDAFRATLAEALEADLLLILADVSDDPVELERKLFTSRQEVFTRFYGEDIDEEFPWQNDAHSLKNHVMTVLTKADRASDQQVEEAIATVSALGLPEPYIVSSHTGRGIQKLKDAILFHLFGPQVNLLLLAASEQSPRGIEGYVSDVYDAGLVTETKRSENGTIAMTVWIHEQALARLVAHSKGRIEVK